MIRYAKYWLLAMDEHSLQSPFVFDVYRRALQSSRRRKVYDSSIEKYRRSLRQSQEMIATDTLGAMSKLSSGTSKRISHIARWGISDRKQSEILVHLVEYYGCLKVLELGTSLGINTMYLSQASTVEKIVTIEGNEELAMLAKQSFDSMGFSNIELTIADIDEYLDQTHESFDLVYMDANHTTEATLRYFTKIVSKLSDHSLVVLDDINWSPGMSKAWAMIQSQFEYLTIENNKIGIVFVDKPGKKSNYILSF